MKNIAVFIVLLAVGTSAFSQATLRELSPFDKMIVKGNVEEIKLIPAHGESPTIKIEGVAQQDLTASVSAGILNLILKNGDKPAKIEVFNNRIKRISGPENVTITGAEVIGGETGNYLVVSFGNRTGGSWIWAGEGVHINIPDIDIDIPEPPEMNFDFEHFEKEFKFNWNDHKEEIKLWSEEWSEEVKEAMKKAREEMEKAREQMEEARKEEIRKNEKNK